MRRMVHPSFPTVTIGTVEYYQGLQTKILIVSPTRTHGTGLLQSEEVYLMT